MAAARYPILAGRGRVETEVERSRFICTIVPIESVEEATAFIAEVSAEFADATHNCWAYVVGPPGSTAQIGMSDDGEPHNTAGRPMLNVLLHADVGDVACVVTRYFGGTKLGRGGLVRAYGGAVQAALDGAERAEKVEWASLSLTFDYAHLSALEQKYPSFEVRVDKVDFGEKVRHELRLPVEKRDGFLAVVADLTRGQVAVDSP